MSATGNQTIIPCSSKQTWLSNVAFAEETNNINDKSNNNSNNDNSSSSSSSSSSSNSSNSKAAGQASEGEAAARTAGGGQRKPEPPENAADVSASRGQPGCGGSKGFPGITNLIEYAE